MKSVVIGLSGRRNGSGRANNDIVDRLEAYERRAWRLAMLLTGDAQAAEAVVRTCIDAQKNPGQLTSPSLDRLVVQAARNPHMTPAKRGFADRCRDRLAKAQADHRVRRGRPMLAIEPTANEAQTDFSPESRCILDVLRSLPHQQREAWILRQLDGVELIAATKAMDSSKTALARHLDLANEALRKELGDREADLVAALKRDADALDPEPFINRRRSSRASRRAWRLRVAITAILLAIVVGIVVWRLVVIGAAQA